MYTYMYMMYVCRAVAIRFEVVRLINSAVTLLRCTHHAE